MRRISLVLVLALGCSSASTDKSVPANPDANALPGGNGGSSMGSTAGGGAQGSGGSGTAVTGMGGTANSGRGGMNANMGGSGAGGQGMGGNSMGAGGNVGTGGSGGRADGGASPDARTGMGGMPGPANGSPYVYVSGYNATINILQLDMATGTLTKKGTATGAGNSPTYLAFSQEKKYLFAINEAGGANSKVTGFSINAADGALTKINDAPAGGDGSPHLSVHPSGKLVLVAHYGSGHVATVPIDAMGKLGTAPSDVLRPANSTSHQIISDSTGAYAFVCNVNSNTIFQFKVDAATGKLMNNGQVMGFPGGAGPRHMAFHPTKPWAFTINETATSVSSLSYDTATGKLSAPKTISSLPAGVADTGAISGAHIIVHPSGKFVFSSNRGHNSISVSSVDPTDGHLTHTSNQTGGGDIATPRDFGMDPGGKYLIVANQSNDRLVVLEIDQTTGALTPKTKFMPIMNASFVGVITLP